MGLKHFVPIKNICMFYEKSQGATARSPNIDLGNSAQSGFPAVPSWENHFAPLGLSLIPVKWVPRVRSFWSHCQVWAQWCGSSVKSQTCSENPIDHGYLIRTEMLECISHPCALSACLVSGMGDTTEDKITEPLPCGNAWPKRKFPEP